jgi:hypothetical protein
MLVFNSNADDEGRQKTGEFQSADQSLLHLATHLTFGYVKKFRIWIALKWAETRPCYPYGNSEARGDGMVAVTAW